MIKLRNILLEGTYDNIVLGLSRNIVNAIKANKKKYEDYIDIERKNDEYANVDITINIKPNNKLKWSHSIKALADLDTLEATIEYNPKYFPIAWNDLIAEIKDMLRHEIEHIGQANFSGKIDYEEKGKTTFKQYVLLKHEVPAYVQGLFKRAKTKRITLDKAMDEWYSENGQFFKNAKEWEDVKKVWTDWAKKNLPTAQWSDNNE